MSDLSSLEKRKLEKLFGMASGYVLDFSNRTFGDFVEEASGRNVYAPGYDVGGTSKANRLRHFWEMESNHLVGRLIGAMIDYGLETSTIRPDEAALVEDCRRVVERLSTASAVHDLDALRAPVDDRDFETVAKQVRDAIDKNEPEAGLDRLHTFVIKFVRSISAARGISADRTKPLHSLFGEYVKALRAEGHIESQMTDRILKSSISTLEAFNDVRNNQSLAHDNSILNYDESLLIFNHIASSIRFLKAIEDRLKARSGKQSAAPDSDIPF